MPPKRRYWKTEQAFGSAFSMLFSRAWAHDLGDDHMKLLRKDTPKCLVGLPISSFGRKTSDEYETIVNSSRMFVVFCKHILAVLSQRERLIARMLVLLCCACRGLEAHPCKIVTKCVWYAYRMFVVFCKPILAILLQRKHQTINKCITHVCCVL